MGFVALTINLPVKFTSKSASTAIGNYSSWFKFEENHWVISIFIVLWTQVGDSNMNLAACSKLSRKLPKLTDLLAMSIDSFRYSFLGKVSSVRNKHQKFENIPITA